MATSETIGLPERLSRALSSFDVARLEPFLSALRDLYADDMTFRDPMQSCRGLDAFIALNRRLAKMAREIRFDVNDTTGDDSRFYLHWVLHMKPKLGPKVAVEGVSRIIAREGRIVEHVDFWDLGELIASPFGGQRLVHTLFRPFV